MEPIIEFSDAKIYQQGHLILSDINLSLNKGEFAYLIGKTGTGKSSLLRTLYCDLPLLEGNATIAEFDLAKIKSKQIPYLRRKLGIVFQDFQLLNDRNIEKNLEFAMQATGWKNKDEIKTRIKDVLDKVSLGTKGFKMPFELSGGEQQRVAIARALISETDLILADEPTGNLDYKTSEEIFSYFIKLKKLNKTIIFATHNRDLANKADYKLSILNGNIKRANV